MSLSTLLTGLFSETETATERSKIDAADESGDGVDSVTVVCECRHCGTNVPTGTAQCPTCESNEIVTYSIE
ncbi:hypothetical protein [Natrinema sp. HArc-T2]|uniref:hypothetical protein n=1 Tax=Natrinema sp. HArc-T2 TaxID=3242701 RepID=UPI00359E1C26